MASLEGKVAVVLGAANRDNMAQVIARQLAAEGARVCREAADLVPNLADIAARKAARAASPP